MSTKGSAPPSTYEEILDQHRTIKGLLGELKGELGSGSCARERVGDITRRLLGVLETHFAAEEEGGYFAEAIAVAPRLSRQASVLEAQHPELLDRLGSLLSAVDGDDFPASARARHEEFREALLEHESAENDLLYDAFETDLGGDG